MADADPRLLFGALAALMVAAALYFVLPWRRRRSRGLHAGAERDAGAELDAGAGSVTGAGLHGDAAAPASGRRARWATAVVLGLGLPAAAIALYVLLGDPGALGDARSELSEQLLAANGPTGPAAAEHVYAELERHLQRQPGDGRARVLKARLDTQAQRFDVAAAGYAKALQDPSKVAGDPTVWVEYAEAVGMAQGGTLIGQPQQLVARALSLNPTHPQALDLAGSAAWELRDFAQAAQHWKRLLEQIPPGSARHVELSAAIEAAERRARFSLPPARP